MLYTHYTEELLGSQEVKVTNIEEKEGSKHISIEIEQKSSAVPAAESKQKIKAAASEVLRQQCAAYLRRFCVCLVHKFHPDNRQIPLDKTSNMGI